MPKISMIESSKKNWFAEPKNEHNYPGDVEVQLGCLMRMADSLETIAQDKKTLENHLDYYKQKCKSQEEEITTLLRKNAALRGHIKRLKK